MEVQRYSGVNERDADRVIDAERQVEIVVDLANHVVGKCVLQQAAAAIAERLLPKPAGL
jgi:hypothetical protein